MLRSLLTKTAHRWINAAILTLLSSCLTSLTTHATLPPDPPKGVSVLNSNGRALRTGILTNCNVDMISLVPDWNLVEPTEGIYDWTDYIDKDLNTIFTNGHGQAVLLRINTMGNSQNNGGKIPDWVYTAMGEDPTSLEADPGVTYSFFDGDVPHCIPVFWNPVYLAKKKALIAMAGAHITANPQFSSQVQVVAISYANAITEDWNVPHDTDGSPSEVELWLNDPVTGNPPGAGYTTQKMIDAAIHQADASFNDGSVTTGNTLNSPTATFTQADVGCIIVGRGYRRNTHIASWISPTQVTLDRPLITGTGRRFTMKNRRDGLIDVAMAAFPNQYITTAVGGNGPDLDAATGDPDPGTYLARTVDTMASTTYPTRYIVQRNNVTAIIPTKDVATDAWVILADAADAGMPTAGQALSNCYNDSTYQMNGGNSNNCNHEDPNCAPWSPPCVDPCAISYQQELDFSGDHIFTYNASYYEVYYLDAGNLSLAHLHCVFNPDVNCGSCFP